MKVIDKVELEVWNANTAHRTPYGLSVYRVERCRQLAVELVVYFQQEPESENSILCRPCSEDDASRTRAKTFPGTDNRVIGLQLEVSFFGPLPLYCAMMIPSFH